MFQESSSKLQNNAAVETYDDQWKQTGVAVVIN